MGISHKASETPLLTKTGQTPWPPGTLVSQKHPDGDVATNQLLPNN